MTRPARWLQRIGLLPVWALGFGATLWAIGAYYFDFPIPSLRAPIAIVYGIATVVVLIAFKRRSMKLGIIGVGFVLTLIWWFSIKPSNDRQWMADVSQTAWAEIDGDNVMIHNIRNCDYRSENDYTSQWETRTYRLSQITEMDIAICYWGSPWMAHPIVSFQFANMAPVCFSIETRKEVGESYSAVRGIYRQYELIYVVADERDVLRLRTNYRHGEDVYLYRTTASPEQARARFLEYLSAVNALHSSPRWYNAVTTNCTTSIRAQRPTAARMPWDWRILVNGKGDELLYQRHLVATGGLSFAELKQQSRINDRARIANQDTHFSDAIRKGVPGFGE